MKTHFEQTGQGAPVVYLHGWGCDGNIFRPIVERLPDYTNYLIDFAGFGKSFDPPQSGWTVFDYANQLIEFLTDNCSSPVTLVGHSFGCRIAMIVAVLRPELVSRLLLVAPAGLRRFSLKRWFKVKKYRINRFLGKVPDQNVGSDDYRNCGNNLKNTFVKVINQDLSTYARRVCQPTLIVASKDDKSVPIKDARRLHKLIKTSELVEIDGDHFAFFYVPRAFADTIKAF